MAVKLGVVMDPISGINVKKDTTLAMLLAAQHHGCEIFYMEQRDLFLKENIVTAHMQKLTVANDAKHWFKLEKNITKPLHELDVVLMRKDPPFNMEYVYTTYLLELAEKKGTWVINNPRALRDCNEKMFTAWFPQCCPPTLVTRTAKDLKNFLGEYPDAIFKPLSAMGGVSVFRISKQDPNLNVIIETITQYETQYVMAQKYIPEILKGDKRILLIDGKTFDYALARIAAQGESRANLAVGGHGEGVPLSDRDRWICEQVGPVLREKGLLFVGLDVIGDYLTEINVTSPTCVRELNEIYHVDIADQFIQCVLEKIKNKK